MCLAEEHNTVMPVSLEPGNPSCLESSTLPLCSLYPLLSTGNPGRQKNVLIGLKNLQSKAQFMLIRTSALVVLSISSPIQHFFISSNFDIKMLKF